MIDYRMTYTEALAKAEHSLTLHEQRLAQLEARGKGAGHMLYDSMAARLAGYVQDVQRIRACSPDEWQRLHDAALARQQHMLAVYTARLNAWWDSVEGASHAKTVD